MGLTRYQKLLAKIPSESDVFVAEYWSFLETIRKMDIRTPYYVYQYYCPVTGNIFYCGKGKGRRAWDHIFQYEKPNGSNKVKNELIRKIIEDYGEYPGIIISHHSLTEDQAFNIEAECITKIGKISSGGTLANIIDGGNRFNSSFSLCSIAGKIGGRTARNTKVGIFSPDYDRGAQTRQNWALGIMNHVDFAAGGVIAGNNNVKNKIGIHNSKYEDKRSEWAGALALATSGNGGGVTNAKWREAKLKESPDYYTKNAAAGGRIGGKKTGSMYWRNNGATNKKSIVCPGEGWIRGMLMSQKKKSTLFGRKNVNTMITTQENNI